MTRSGYAAGEPARRAGGAEHLRSSPRSIRRQVRRRRRATTAAGIGVWAMAGKMVRGSVYIHASAASELSPHQRGALERAKSTAGPSDWNVARISGQTVSLMLYGDFDTAPFPTLSRSVRIELPDGPVSRRDYGRSPNPPILHRKELLLSSNDDRRDGWSKLTRRLVLAGAFEDPHLIGYRRQWLERLCSLGLDVQQQ